MAIPKDIHEAFKFVNQYLEGFQHPWVLTGSLVFAYQSIPLTPHDIDIQTNEAGAYEMEKLFKDYMVRGVTFSESSAIRSHFGEAKISGIKVEIIGDIEKRDNNGHWSNPVDLKAMRTFINYEGMTIPILPLAYEYKAYMQMGREEKAKLLAKYI